MVREQRFPLAGTREQLFHTYVLDPAGTSGMIPSGASPSSVLILGIYLADELNNVGEIVAEFSEARRYEVTQRWVALGGPPPSERVAGVTVSASLEKAPKFQLLNELLAKEDLAEYEYVLIIDDDIVLPDQFVDRFLPLQSRLGFSIAQPARTNDSYLDHPIVERQWGVAARQTLFVEIGPVVSFHRSIYDLVFPFDMASSMGWGYENVWSHLLAQRNMKMGIIDILPVEHNLRKPVAHYGWEHADTERVAFLAKNEHLPLEECFRVLDVINLKDAVLQEKPRNLISTSPAISVMIPTHNRCELFKSTLESLVRQSLPKDQYEVIIVDDGSTDTTPDICRMFSSMLALKYFSLTRSGISAAKNLGVFASSGNVLLLLDEDDIADQDLLREHLEIHEKNPRETLAVLGYASWARSLHVTEIMKYVSDLGDPRFCDVGPTDEQRVDFTSLWWGRLSCKRSFLVRHGGFKQQLALGLEDIELGYRLSKFGLEVIFNPKAVSYKNRPVFYDELCRLSERQGGLQFLMTRLHRDPAIHRYCQVDDAQVKWPQIQQNLDQKLRRVHEIETSLTSRLEGREKDLLLRELRALYGWTLDAFRMKGLVEAMHSQGRV